MEGSKLSTMYNELLTAAGKDFPQQAEGEPDGHYMRRLVLAVSKCSDDAWESLSSPAHDWYNAQAVRVKAHQNPEDCPGFEKIILYPPPFAPEHIDVSLDTLRVMHEIGTIHGGIEETTAAEQAQLIREVMDAGWPARGPEGDVHILTDAPIKGAFNPDEAEAIPLVARDGKYVAPDDQNSPHVDPTPDKSSVRSHWKRQIDIPKKYTATDDGINAAMDCGKIDCPELPKPSSNDVAHQDSSPYVSLDWPLVSRSQLEAVKNGTGRIEDEEGNEIVMLPKHTATDAVRAIVIQHQDWNQVQILREMEAQGRAVTMSTIATVRSMTLATIAVAKGLEKWVEG